jgi:very-short-patch-repair endonuclease
MRWVAPFAAPSHLAPARSCALPRCLVDDTRSRAGARAARARGRRRESVEARRHLAGCRSPRPRLARPNLGRALTASHSHRAWRDPTWVALSPLRILTAYGRYPVPSTFREAVAILGDVATSVCPECAGAALLAHAPRRSAHDVSSPHARAHVELRTRPPRHGSGAGGAKPGRTPANTASSKYCRAHQALVIQRAIAMRSALTPSERALWTLLRGGQLGVWFRRQVPLGRFVADFVTQSAWLVVKVAGDYHARRRAADARRDRALARLGYRVLRLEAPLRSGRSRGCAKRSAGTESHGALAHLPRSRGGAPRAEHELGGGRRAQRDGWGHPKRTRQVLAGSWGTRCVRLPCSSTPSRSSRLASKDDRGPGSCRLPALPVPHSVLRSLVSLPWQHVDTAPGMGKPKADT